MTSFKLISLWPQKHGFHTLEAFSGKGIVDGVRTQLTEEGLPGLRKTGEWIAFPSQRGPIGRANFYDRAPS